MVSEALELAKVLGFANKETALGLWLTQMWATGTDVLGRAKERVVLRESSQHVSCVMHAVMMLGLMCQGRENPGLLI